MPLKEEEKQLLENEDAKLTLSLSSLTPAKIGIKNLLRQRYLNNDRKVYSSLEFASASSEESFEDHPYSNINSKHKSKINLNKA